MENKSQNSRHVINALLSDLRHAERQAEEEANSLKAARERHADVLAAQAIIQETAEAVQRLAHKQISKVVTRCLEAVFGEEAYTFEIDFSQKRGKTEAALLFVRDGQEIDPVDAAGGGVVDVAAFALRLACLLLTRPKRRLFLAMDEPFRFLSADHIPAVREMLEMLAKDFKIQFLIVTHQQRLRVGTIMELGND